MSEGTVNLEAASAQRVLEGLGYVYCGNGHWVAPTLKERCGSAGKSFEDYLGALREYSSELRSTMDNLSEELDMIEEALK